MVRYKRFKKSINGYKVIVDFSGPLGPWFIVECGFIDLKYYVSKELLEFFPDAHPVITEPMFMTNATDEQIKSFLTILKLES